MVDCPLQQLYRRGLMCAKQLSRTSSSQGHPLQDAHVAFFGSLNSTFGPTPPCKPYTSPRIVGGRLQAPTRALFRPQPRSTAHNARPIGHGISRPLLRRHRRPPHDHPRPRRGRPAPRRHRRPRLAQLQPRSRHAEGSLSRRYSSTAGVPRAMMGRRMDRRGLPSSARFRSRGSSPSSAGLQGI